MHFVQSNLHRGNELFLRHVLLLLLLVIKNLLVMSVLVIPAK